MAETIHSVLHGWAGDQKRNRVIVTLGATNETITPSQVGLKQVTAVVPTGRTGTLSGASGPVASVVTATFTSWDNDSSILYAAAAKVEFDFYGY